MAQAAFDPAPHVARLRRRLAELERRVDDIEHELDEPMPQDWGDRASERDGDEVLESLGAAGVVEIRQIKAALTRAQEGEYGYCVKCGARINENRLKIVPHAALCQSCAV